MMMFDPAQRLTARQALDHPFFKDSNLKKWTGKISYEQKQLNSR